MDAAEVSAPEPRRVRLWKLAALALVAAGVAARAAALWTDFWLDEVWSYELSLGLGSALDVFTRLHHSNNHHLNTLFLYLVGPDAAHWAVYRALSLAAGLSAIALVAANGARWGRLQAWLAAALGASSYVLVFHSAEARGYALAVAFALLAYWQLEPLCGRPSWRGGGLFGLTVLLGCLSHLQFVHVYAAAGAWTVSRAARSRAPTAHRVRGLVQQHATAIALLGGLWWVDVRHVHIGGGPPYELLEVLGSTAALALGVPRAGWLPAAALGAFCALGVAGMVRLARRGDDSWVFFAVVIFASPALLLSFLRPEVLFERYFVLGHAFLLLLLADLLAGWLRGGAPSRWAAAALLAAISCGNATLVARFLRDGSGRYLAALEHVARETAGPVARLASDNDGRTERMLAFYARWLPPGERIEYVPQSRWPDEIEWVLAHSLTEAGPRDEALWIGERRFDFVRRFPRGSHAGWDWFLFRRAAP